VVATEPALGRNTGFFKTNPAKGHRSREIGGNAEAVQRRHAIRHQALATRFIDRRARPIRYEHFNPRKRRAIAAASPAGPPPTTTTSGAVINWLSSIQMTFGDIICRPNATSPLIITKQVY
jgi:hypothetical protein